MAESQSSPAGAAGQLGSVSAKLPASAVTPGSELLFVLSPTESESPTKQFNRKLLMEKSINIFRGDWGRGIFVFEGEMMSLCSRTNEAECNNETCQTSHYPAPRTEAADCSLGLGTLKVFV